MIKNLNWLSGLFQAAADTFMNSCTSIIPMALILLTVFNTLTLCIGERNLDNFSRFLSKYRVLAYTVLPFVSWILLCNPMVFSAGKFLPKKQRAGYIDAVSTTNAAMLSAFPFVNPAEIMIWLGIAQGVGVRGSSMVELSIRFLIGAWILALIRGITTEKIWVFLAKRSHINIDEEYIIEKEYEIDDFKIEPLHVEPLEEQCFGLLDYIINKIEKIGMKFGNVIGVFLEGAQKAINTMIKKVLPFIIFISFAITLITYTGIGNLLTNILIPLVSNLWGIGILVMIISIPVISPILAPGTVVQAILGTTIGSMIAAGILPVSYALPALFAINILDTCDFIPVAASLSDTDAQTTRIAVPAMLFSRFLTSPLTVIIGIIVSIGFK